MIPESEQAAWDAIPEELLPRKQERTCATCAYNGCCDGLPNCGGHYWKDEDEGDAE